MKKIALVSTVLGLALLSGCCSTYEQCQALSRALGGAAYAIGPNSAGGRLGAYTSGQQLPPEPNGIISSPTIVYDNNDNVDLKHGFIRLDITKNGERRDIPISDELRPVLQAVTRRLDVPYVFFDATTGKPYQDVKRSFGTALRRAGITDFHFHDLRHTFASHLVMARVDITTVSKLLGHKSLTMTLRYAHLAPNHLQNAVNMLNITGEEKRTAYLLHSVAGN